MNAQKKKKPRKRIQIGVSDQAYEVLDRFSYLTGQTKSKIVWELLEVTIPSLTRSLALLEAAREAPLEVKEGLRDVFEGIEQEMLTVAGITNREMMRLNDQADDAISELTPGSLIGGSQGGSSISNVVSKTQSSKKKSKKKAQKSKKKGAKK